MYLNFTGLADEQPDAGVADTFGPNLQRLAEMKSTYDPDNFVRRNNNVVPAGSIAGLSTPFAGSTPAATMLVPNDTRRPQCEQATFPRATRKAHRERSWR
jgi:hypothetical protein